MIQKTDVLFIRQWFDTYVHQFCTGDERIDSAICLKVKHTKKVASEILDIANTLHFNAEHLYLAEIAAILHDIGRFEQYLRYHTYSDQKSEDHAKIGLEVMAQTGVIGRLEHHEQDLIRNIVAYHNRAELPRSEDQEFLFLLKLLRDADKVDIIRVVTEHYNSFSRNSAINLGLPDTHEISDEIINSVLNCKIANLKDMKTVNDFKLVLVSWVFDLNFPRTYQIFKQRSYFDNLSATLPQTANITQAIASASSFLLRNCHNERSKSECQIP